MRLKCWENINLNWPIYGTHQEKLRFLLHFAQLAPSIYNTQPWQYRLQDGNLDLFFDNRRRLSVVDPDNREQIMSCGCAIEFLKIAAWHFSHELNIDYYPDDENPNWLARIGIQPCEPADDFEIKLFHAMWRRHTNRTGYQPVSIPGSELKLLHDISQFYHSSLDVVTHDYRQAAIANLIARSDQIQAGDKEFRQELAQWIRPNQSGCEDGMPGYVFGLNDLSASVHSFVTKTFNWGDKQALTDKTLVRDSSALLVLSSDDDSQLSWLKTGETLARLLLTITTQDLQASFLNQPIKQPELRARLKQLLKTSRYPQTILRVGYALPSKHTPRRVLDHIVTEEYNETLSSML